MSTIQAIEGFEKLVLDHKVDHSKFSTEKILADIEQVRKAKPEVYHQKHIGAFLEQRAKVLNELADNYIKATIGAKYPVISPELWKLQRYLQLKIEGDKKPVVIKDETVKIPPEATKYVLAVPLLAHVFIGGNDTCQLAKQEISLEYGNKLKIELTATMPGTLGANLRKAYRQAMANAYNLVGSLLSQECIGDLFADNLETIKPQVFVAWIPTIDSLKIKHNVVHPPVKLDPAMFLKLREQCYLVAMWAVDDEVPLEHFLREYTEGSLEKVVKGND